MECYKFCIVVSTLTEPSCVSLYSDWLTSAKFRYLNLVTCLSSLYLYQMESETPSDSSLSLAEASHWWWLPLILHLLISALGMEGVCSPCPLCLQPPILVASFPVSLWHTKERLSLAGHSRHIALSWPRAVTRPTALSALSTNSTNPQEKHQETRRVRKRTPSIPQLLGLHPYTVEVRAS